MKNSKISCIVTLVFAVIFAVVGAVMLLLPEPESPVSVSGKPAVNKVGSTVKVLFTFENDSNEDVVITYMEITVPTSSNVTDVAQVFESVRVEAHDSYECEITYSSYHNPKNVTEITVRIDGKEYDVYGSAPIYTTVAIVLFLFAAVFVILTVCGFIGYNRQKKRYEDIKREINDKFAGNAIFTVGCCGIIGDAGKAAAKTTASVAIGAVFACLFGFGAYKIYGTNVPKEFVVSDEGLFVGNPMKKGFNLGSMNYMEKGSLSEAEVSVKKKRVKLANRASGEFFLFDLSGNKDVTPEQLAEKLNNLTTSVPPSMAGEVAAESADAPTENDPFDI